MRILLLGEYSNVHATLAKGLRRLGHRVTVVSNGDFWKDYPRDIDVSRHGTFGGLRLYLRLLSLLPRFRGYDIVQLINPMFFEIKAERLYFFYHYLRRHNRRVVLGGFGMDYYWVHECITRFPLRYSDFNFGTEIRQDREAQKYIREWIATPKGDLCQYIANDCDKIITGLYEYWACYQPVFPDKTAYCPFPIVPRDNPPRPFDGTLRLFLGINRERSAYKGTDIMLKAAQRIAAEYPGKVDLKLAESLPFAAYTQCMDHADAILDQLYSYTPAMNALEAMARGLICIGGGEEEHYALLQEETLRPIVNVRPSEADVCRALRRLLARPERIDVLKRESMLYVRRHHDYLKVARRYIEIYEALLRH